MKRVIKVTDNILKRIKNILSDLEKVGKTEICPLWIDDSDCNNCHMLFPKANNDECPCNVYSKEYLIKRLKEIIKFNENN